MRSIALPSVGNFRSNVQWFLEGNTPNHQTEVLADLALSLRALALHLASGEGLKTEDQSVQTLNKVCQEMTRRDLQDVQKLRAVITAVEDVVEKKFSALTETQQFREVVVQLIVVAETHPDLQLKKAVLELSRKL